MKSEHEDESILVGSGELAELFVPCGEEDAFRVAVEGEVRREGAAAGCLGAVRAVVELEDLEKTVFGASGEPALIVIPRDGTKALRIRNSNFLVEVRKHMV